MPDAPPVLISKSEADRGRYFDTRPKVARELLASRDRRVLVDGPLGTGKTRLLLEKVRACCLRYPRCRWLILRSVRKWLTNSALVTWEEKVVVPGELAPDRIRREGRTEYRFRNGSAVVVAGLDDPQGVFSAEYDGAALIEAIEIDQDTAEKVDGRLRFARMPYQQFLMDCNPGGPSHWLHRAFSTGWCRRLPMRHTDNPALYQPDGTRTPFGTQYLARLDDLTGVRRDRLRDGKWVQAEGAIYTDWDAENLVTPFAVPKDWPRFHSIDFGYTNPLVYQFWARDPDGRLYLYREYYHTGWLVEDVAKWVKADIDAGREPKPRAVVGDHDAEDRATFERHSGLTVIAADKKVADGIQDVAARIRKAGDGKRRLFVFRDARCHKADPHLLEAAKPACTADEFDGYVWDDAKRREQPVKENDHGMDATRYLVRHVDAKNRPGNFSFGAG